MSQDTVGQVVMTVGHSIRHGVAFVGQIVAIDIRRHTLVCAIEIMVAVEKEKWALLGCSCCCCCCC